MTPKARILVVEDEADVRELIQLHLRRDGHEPSGVDNGEEALQLLSRGGFDLAIVDWMLPGLPGVEICRRAGGKLPILMVTARAESADIVLGLEAGADDYITKPFEVPVLLARVRALLRRAAGTRAEAQAAAGAKASLIRVGELEVDPEAHEVRCAGQEVSLTISEFRLLAALLENRGKALSRDRLIELVQGQGVTVVDRAIDTHVFGLRKKLGPCADVIETIRGVGYRVRGA